MKSESDQYKIALFEAVMKYIGIVLAILYVGMGLAVILRANEIFDISATYALPLGSILVVYGLFRGYRVYQKYFQR